MKISISLPDELVADVDRARGDVSRSLFIRRRLEVDWTRSLKVGVKAPPSTERSPTAGREVEALAEAGAPQRALEAAAARDIAHTLRTEPSVFEPPSKGHPGHKQPCKCLNCERARGNVS